nr:hypothetical protein [Mesorhizobium sp.]
MAGVSNAAGCGDKVAKADEVAVPVQASHFNIAQKTLVLLAASTAKLHHDRGRP